MSEQLHVEMNDLIVPVLCYPFPEVRELLTATHLPQDFHMSQLAVPQAQELLDAGGYPFAHDLVLPTDDQEYVDFEHVHEPITARITERNESLLPGLSEFQRQYPTHGSADGIFRLMAGWSATGKMTELGFVQGDYDGYILDAVGLNIPVHSAPSLEAVGPPVEGRVWFVSNPSAVNGNWHDDEGWRNFIAAGHKVVLDYAYGGLTTDYHPLDVSAPNIQAVLTSPSKIFGVFNHRYTGVGAGIVRRDTANPNVYRADETPSEIGHIPLSADPFDTFENRISGPALERTYGVSAKELSDRHPAWSHVGETAAQLCLMLGLTHGVERVVVCGGVGGGASDLYRKHLLRAIDHYSEYGNSTQHTFLPVVSALRSTEADTFELHGAQGVVHDFTTRAA